MTIYKVPTIYLRSLNTSTDFKIEVKKKTSNVFLSISIEEHNWNSFSFSNLFLVHVYYGFLLILSKLNENNNMKENFRDSGIFFLITTHLLKSVVYLKAMKDPEQWKKQPNKEKVYIREISIKTHSEKNRTTHSYTLLCK